jgi:hypothetical protein
MVAPRHERSTLHTPTAKAPIAAAATTHLLRRHGCRILCVLVDVLLVRLHVLVVQQSLLVLMQKPVRARTTTISAHT